MELSSEIKRDFGPNKIMEVLTPIYASRFSIKEIRELTTFFKSSTGKKWSQLLPDIQQASFNAGDALGFQIGQRLNELLKARGYAHP